MIIGEFKTIFDADVKGFVAAAKDIQAATARTTRAFKNVSAAGQENAKAYGRQELAMKRAWTQQLSMTQSIKQLGLEESKQKALLDQLGTALSTYTKQLNSGTLSTQQMGRATVAFGKNMREISNEIRNVQASGNKFGALTNALRNLESASILAVGPLSGIGARLRSLSAITTRTTLAVAAMFGTITAGLVGFFKLAKAAITVNAELASVEARLMAASGSMAQVGRDMKFLTGLSTRLGLDLVTTATAFSRFNASAQGTSLEGAKAKKVFEGISIAGAALRLSSIEMEGIFRAVEQMMSKGTVQAEELRGQLGERLPGAFRLAAEAMGVNTMQLNAMLKKGEVLAEDMLPKLDKLLRKTFGATAESNANTLAGAWNNLTTEFKLFANEVNDSSGITDALVDIIKDLTIGMKDLADNINLVIAAYKKMSTLSAVATKATIPLTSSIISQLDLWGLLWEQLREGGREYGLLKNKATLSLGNIGDAMEALKEKAKAAKEWLDKFKSFSFGFQDTADDIQDLVDELDNFTKAKEMAAKGRDFETALEQVEWQAKLAGSSFADLVQVSWALWTQFKVVAIPTADGVAKALADLWAQVRDGEDAMDKAKDAAEALADAQYDLVVLGKELDAARQGEDAYKLYTDITKEIDEIIKELTDLGIAESEINKIIAQRLPMMVALTAEQQKMKDAAKAHKEVLKEEERLTKALASAQDKQVSALDRADEAIDQMYERVKALSKGGEDLRFFEQVEQPIARMAFELKKAGVEQTELNARVAEYKVLLDTVFNMTGPLAKAGDDIGDAFGQAFEDAITGASSFKEAMEDMIKSIYRTLLRTLIIDPIVDDLQTQLKAWFTQDGTIASAKNILKGGGGQSAATQGAAAGITAATGSAAGAGDAAGTAAVQGQWQAVIAQFQAVVAQDQAVVATTQGIAAQQQANTTLFQGSLTEFTAGNTLMTTAATGLNTAAAALSLSAAELAAAGAAGGIADAAGGLAEASSGGFAGGGNARRGKIYEVNENGPEMFYSRGRQYLMPNADGRVDPMNEGGRGGRGMVFNQTINMPPEKVRRTVSQYAQETGRVTQRAIARNR